MTIMSDFNITILTYKDSFFIFKMYAEREIEIFPQF